MPDILTAAGLQTKTQEELFNELSSALKTIYGEDIDLSDPSTPDSQAVMLFVQSGVDVRELITQVYTSFDPDQAIGRVQDQRYGLNAIQRKGGTYTLVFVNVVVNGAVTLYGVDQEQNDVFRISDNAGTEFELVTTISLPSAGTFNLLFKAVDPGKVETLPNTLTTPITVVLQVLSVNNPTAPIVVGINEETDEEFKNRRLISTAISSQGYIDGLEAMLKNINGIVSAKVYENDTNENPDANGVPAHTVWVVVSGDYEESEVAQAIYAKRGTGAGMKGDITYDVVRPNNSIFTARWDNVVQEDLFIKFQLSAIDPSKPINYTLIKEKIAELYVPDVAQTVNINDISCLVGEIDSNAIVINPGFSLSEAGPFTASLATTGKNKQFRVAEENIIITPIVIQPAAATVVGGAEPGTRSFIAFGGWGEYTWAFAPGGDNSGGSIIENPDGSVSYTAGPTAPTSDVLRVTDELGNTKDVTITVTA